jgi:hypothetical protein
MKINPELQIGDKVILLYMQDETMIPGLRGVVDSVAEFFGEKIYGVKWENGKSLSLLSDVDKWKLEKKKKIDESSFDKFVMNNLNIFRFFDRGFFIDYLKDIRDSGMVNMFGASPYLYMGRERIAHEFYYKEFDEESQEAFDRVLEKADEAQSIMVQGVIKILEKEKKDYDVNTINNYLRNYSQKILEFYIHLLSVR